jgi:hypothetical protein
MKQEARSPTGLLTGRFLKPKPVRFKSTMPTYYHSAPLLLAPGAVIQPGNWGRIINCYKANQAPVQAWIMARELAFEVVRTESYPHLPSRLSCCFAFDSLDHANQYASEFSPWNSLYEVELVNPSAPIHRGAFNLINHPPATVEYLPVAIASARAYWAGERIEVPEILTESPLRILSLVSSGPGAFQPKANGASSTR